MNTDTQISRGLERIMAQNVGAYLEGMFGLSGMGACDTFSSLEDVATEAGVPNMPARSRKMRRAHSRACKCMSDAVPVAVAVQSALEEVNGSEPLPFAEQAETLAGIGDYLGATSAAKIAAKAQKAATSAQKKIDKLTAKEAKQEAKVAAKVAKYEAAGKTAKAQKVIAKDAKQDAKVAAKITKLQNVIGAANTAVQNLTAAPSTPVTPAEVAAAVLTNQTQLPATSDLQTLAQQVLANAAAPGSTMPTASLTSATPSAFPDYADSAPATDAAEPAGMFGNIPPVAFIGAGVLALFLLMPKKR